MSTAGAMSQGECRKAPSKITCTAPFMPGAIELLAGQIPTERHDEVKAALLTHISRLCKFQRVCEWKAARAVSGKYGAYVRTRDLNEIYTATGLRHRAWMVLELCHDLNLPPPAQLCEFFASMDAPDSGAYQFERQFHWKRQVALGLAAKAELDGKPLHKRGLAMRARVPRETLRSWMEDDENWGNDLKKEIERQRALLDTAP